MNEFNGNQSKKTNKEKNIGDKNMLCEWMFEKNGIKTVVFKIIDSNFEIDK